MANQDVNYRSLDEGNPFQNMADDHESPNDAEDTPGNSGLMIQIVPETSRAQWNHIEDLDSFFARMYNYHQKHGFTVIVMEEAFQLCEFAFVVWLLTFTVHCVNHAVLFGNAPPGHNHTKVTISDVIVPIAECVDNFSWLTFFILFISALYFMMRLIKFIYHVTQYSDIKKFYNSALLIEDNDLDNTTWHEVKKRIREVQSEQHMCIDKDQITELDIYHRILRFKNYMVALMNKNLLPVKFNAPLFGEVVTLSRGLLYNVDFILFRGPGSPFQNNWQLRDDYAVRSNQMYLAERLSSLILWVAIANFVLAPAIFVWQMIYFLFAYANILRKEPGALGMRTWSNYGRLYLRHFNELDHEQDARLNRAYQHADKYLSSFSSPIMTVVAKNILFISGGLLVLLLALGIYDEFVFQIEHVLTIITALSAIGLVCRTLIPEENLIWCPEQLMTAVLAHAHYLPSEWKNLAHTAIVRKEFGNFFQFKASYILNEICSPLFTPFILVFVFRPKALEIVKFFRTFTVTVKGVGNVCSFAQMNVRKYGNPEWQLQNSTEISHFGRDEEQTTHYPVENGKTELSLVRFTLTNPEWRMPADALTFLKSMRENAVQDLKNLRKPNNAIYQNAMTESLHSFGTLKEESYLNLKQGYPRHTSNEESRFTSIAYALRIFFAETPAKQHHWRLQGTFNKYSSIVNYVFNGQNMLNNSQQLQEKNLNVKNSSKSTNRQLSDFDHMLQQNLEDPFQANHRLNPSSDQDPTTSRYISTSIAPQEKSARKMCVYKTEGRLGGPSEALLYSISNLDPSLATNHVDVTVADMCLSTLYLHELHRQNIKNKKIMTTLTGAGGHQPEIATSSIPEKVPLLRKTSS